MRILGINVGHGAASAYMENGKIRFAIEEEKMSRIKGKHTFPKLGVEYISRTFNVSLENFDVVAVGCEHIEEFVYNYRKLNSYFDKNTLKDKIEGLLFDGLKRFIPAYDLQPRLRSHFIDCMKEFGFKEEQIVFKNHHLAHAASVYYTSPFKDALIFTNDGKGDGLSGGLYTAINGEMTCVDEILDLNSIGQFYQIVTQFLGFKVNRHEGKITGLAAYGDHSKTFPLMNKVFSFENGELINKLQENEELRENPLKFFFRHVYRNGFIHKNYIKCLHGKLINFAAGYQMLRNYMEDNMSEFEPKDMAAGIQKLAEDALVSYLTQKLKSHKFDNICLAGGVFANVRINQQIREIPGVKKVYVQPAMDDAGTSLGAALLAWFDTQEKKEWPALKTVYLGPNYTDEDLEKALKESSLSFRCSERVEEEIAKFVSEGKIVGRFNGALEYGPRALGNRTILASPKDKCINDTLNERLNRTEFMPFAPAILDEDADTYLLNYTDDVATKYMTTTYHTNSEVNKKIDATVHVDGTARPQVVFEADNPSFYRIIKAYKEITGVGVVINTSFNMHEEPIVNAPQDAIRSFKEGAVDVLSLGPFLLEQ